MIDDVLRQPRHAAERNAPRTARRGRRLWPPPRGVWLAHLPFVALLALAAALRIVVQFAYQPALIFPDSQSYLYNSVVFVPENVRPIGYAAFLKVLLKTHDLSVVPAVQHALGLLIAVGIYVLLLRLRVRPWIAALATVPVLFDAYQLDIEQFVMSDTLFEALLLLGVGLLVWRGRRLGYAEVAIAGLVFALATLTRFDAAIMIAPALLFVLFACRGAARKVIAALAMVVTFVVPLGLYAHWYQRTNGSFAIEQSSGYFLYGHVAPFADCATLAMPDYERQLCPKLPVGERHNVNWYVWDKASPAHTFVPPPGMAAQDVLKDFADRVIKHQPVDYAQTVVVNFFLGFRPTHTIEASDDVGNDQWDFGPTLPDTGVDPLPTTMYYGGVPPRVNASLGSFLGHYQTFGYAPGPLLAMCLALGLLGGIGLRARRASDPPPRRAWLRWLALRRARLSRAGACGLLFAIAGIAVVIPADAISLFSWRYQLPQLIFFPAAAALGVTALIARARGAASSTAGDADGGADPQPGETEATADDATRMLDPCVETDGSPDDRSRPGRDGSARS